MESEAINQVLAQVGGDASGFYFSSLPLLKAIAVLLTSFFLGCSVFFMVRTGWIAVRIDRLQDVVLKSNLPKRRSIKAWRKIEKHFFAGDENSLKLALIEADNILDEALKLAGYQGTNLGDRLKKITSAELPNIDQVWEAHKLRNRLVHEADFKMNRELAERALAIYEHTLQDLGLLEVK